jgi:hypothetical protein
VRALERVDGGSVRRGRLPHDRKRIFQPRRRRARRLADEAAQRAQEAKAAHVFKEHPNRKIPEDFRKSTGAVDRGRHGGP